MFANLLESFKQPYRFLVSLFHVLVNGFPAKNLRVIGVTGTDGKTTTCNILYEILKQCGLSVAMVTTVGIKYFVNGTETEIENGLHVTTPDAATVQRLFKKFSNNGVKFVVIEVTSHRLAQLKTVGYNVEIGVLTNLTREHLDYHGTMENYALAKCRLFKGVKVAVINKDDERKDFFVKQIEVSSPNSKIVLYEKTKLTKISKTLAGEYNKYNIGAAECVAGLLGVEVKKIAGVISEFKGVAGRREEIENKRGIRMVVDFAHTPNGLKNILISLKEEMKTSGKLILVFGCTGERDRGKRPEMGLIAEKYADVVVVTADDPRSEDLGQIYSQIVSQVKKDFIREDDRDLAIQKAVEMSKKGDVVIATGMGHEKTILIGSTEVARSDREVFERLSLI